MHTFGTQRKLSWIFIQHGWCECIMPEFEEVKDAAFVIKSSRDRPGPGMDDEIRFIGNPRNPEASFSYGRGRGEMILVLDYDQEPWSCETLGIFTLIPERFFSHRRPRTS